MNIGSGIGQHLYSLFMTSYACSLDTCLAIVSMGWLVDCAWISSKDFSNLVFGFSASHSVL